MSSSTSTEIPSLVHAPSAPGRGRRLACARGNHRASISASGCSIGGALEPQTRASTHRRGQSLGVDQLGAAPPEDHRARRIASGQGCVDVDDLLELSARHILVRGALHVLVPGCPSSLVVNALRSPKMRSVGERSRASCMSAGVLSRSMVLKAVGGSNVRCTSGTSGHSANAYLWSVQHGVALGVDRSALLAATTVSSLPRASKFVDSTRRFHTGPRCYEVPADDGAAKMNSAVAPHWPAPRRDFGCWWRPCGMHQIAGARIEEAEIEPAGALDPSGRRSRLAGHWSSRQRAIRAPRMTVERRLRLDERGMDEKGLEELLRPGSRSARTCSKSRISRGVGRM